MGKKVDIAERLKELGCDPVEGLARIAKNAEQGGKPALAAKVYSDLLGYVAPKLKSVEHSIEPETRDFLDRQQRLARIKQLAQQTGVLGAVDAEFEVVPEKHIPEEP